MDETGWRTAGQRRALWGAFTDRHAVLRIASDRGEQHAKDLLADTTAIVTSDRWWAYGHLPLRRRQVCWAHLQRDFKAHADGLAAEKAFGEAGLRICEELFWTWEIYRHTGDRSELKRRVRALRRELKPLLRSYAGKAPRYRYTRGLAKQPAQDLARPVDVRRPQRRPADQQPRRTRPARRGHLPQAVARQPVRATASAASNACCRPTPPAAYNAAACTPTSSTCSAPTPAATPRRLLA